MSSDSKKGFQNRKSECTLMWLKKSSGIARNEKESRLLTLANSTTALYNSPTQVCEKGRIMML